MCYGCNHSAVGAYMPMAGIERLVERAPVYRSCSAVHYGSTSSLSDYSFSHPAFIPMAAGGLEYRAFSSRDDYRMNIMTYVSGIAQVASGMADHRAFVQGRSPAIPESGSDARVKQLSAQIFSLVTEKILPEDIIISIVDGEDLVRLHASHGGGSSEGVAGFSVNRNRIGDISSIFVRRTRLDLLLLTIGHEIGHVLNPPLDDPVTEEAKAFAFEAAWMQAIHRFDIAGLRENMNIRAFNPAHNGLHNRALDLVVSLMAGKKAPLEIFEGICSGLVTAQRHPDF